MNVIVEAPGAGRGEPQACRFRGQGRRDLGREYHKYVRYAEKSLYKRS